MTSSGLKGDSTRKRSFYEENKGGSGEPVEETTFADSLKVRTKAIEFFRLLKLI